MYFYIKIIAIIENNFQHAITVIITFFKINESNFDLLLRSVNLTKKWLENWKH